MNWITILAIRYSLFVILIRNLPRSDSQLMNGGLFPCLEEWILLPRP